MHLPHLELTILNFYVLRVFIFPVIYRDRMINYTTIALGPILAYVSGFPLKLSSRPTRGFFFFLFLMLIAVLYALLVSFVLPLF